jgi:hypothetical protein
VAQGAPVESLALELAAIDICEDQIKNQKSKITSKEADENTDKTKQQSEKVPNKKKPKKVSNINDLPDDQRKAIQEVINQKNMALGALLALSRWDIKAGQLCFVVEYPIYKDKIMSKGALDIIHSCVTEVIEEKISITCRVERPEDVGEEIEAVFGESI